MSTLPNNPATDVIKQEERIEKSTPVDDSTACCFFRSTSRRYLSRRSQDASDSSLQSSRHSLDGTNRADTLADYPHARGDCVVHPFANGTVEKNCPNCYCYVCDVPVRECKTWINHCQAVQGDEHWQHERAKVKSVNPVAAVAVAATAGIPTEEAPLQIGLFDYGEEVYQMAQTGCSMISQGVKVWNEFITRARRCVYFYRDSKTFLAALELFNRSNHNNVTHDFVMRPIDTIDTLEQDKQHCGFCNQFLQADRMTHYIQETNPQMYNAAFCLGCVGRTLVVRFGRDKTGILAKLEKL
jgi:hypothetical protein